MPYSGLFSSIAILLRIQVVNLLLKELNLYDEIE